MLIVFYVKFSDIDRLRKGEAVPAMESQTNDFYRIEAEVEEVKIYQDPNVSSRRLVKKLHQR